MTRSAHSAALYGACLAGLLLGACSKHPPAPPTNQPATTRTVAAGKPTPAGAARTRTTADAPATASTTANVTAPATSASAPAAPASAGTALSVASVTLGNAVNAARQVTQAGNRFIPSDKTIYASVATVGRSGGATLNAKWSYLEGTGQLISSISQAIATDGPAVTTFMVQNPDLWPQGKYKVEISLDGKPVVTRDFEIATH